MAKKKPIISSLGQWAYPGEVTIIPSSKITMKGVNYPVLGVDDFGNSQVMMPGAEYEFPGNYVTEYPQMGKGGEMIKRKDGSYSKRGLWDNIRANKGSGKKPTKQMLEQERKIKAKMQDGGWLQQYQTAGEVSSEQNPERMNPIEIQTERKPWYERLPRQIGNRIGLDPYHLDDKDFGSQFRQRVSDATGGADWYKQSNPFMNLALEAMNAPQLAATYGVTGKVQTPSEAMDIQNPYGAMAVDMLLDPAVAFGLTKGLVKGAPLVAKYAKTAGKKLGKSITKDVAFTPTINNFSKFDELTPQSMDDIYHRVVNSPGYSDDVQKAIDYWQEYKHVSPELDKSFTLELGEDLPLTRRLKTPLAFDENGYIINSGKPTAFSAGLGNDLLGQYKVHLMAPKGTKVSPISRAASSTTMQGEREILFPTTSKFKKLHSRVNPQTGLEDYIIGLEMKEGGWLNKYQDGGENLPELNSKLDIANFYKNPLSEKYGIYKDPKDSTYRYYLKSEESEQIIEEPTASPELYDVDSQKLKEINAKKASLSEVQLSNIKPVSPVILPQQKERLLRDRSYYEQNDLEQLEKDYPLEQTNNPSYSEILKSLESDPEYQRVINEAKKLVIPSKAKVVAPIRPKPVPAVTPIIPIATSPAPVVKKVVPRNNVVNLADATITGADKSYLNSIEEYCPTGNCLESTRNAYDLLAGRITGIPTSSDIWSKDLNIHSMSTTPSDKDVKKYPYFDGDIGTGTVDSWDIHGVIVATGGKNLYNINTPIPIDYKKIPVGAIVGWGPANKKESDKDSRNKGYNKKFGMQPSNHSTMVSGYSETGEPIIYDSYLEKYMTLTEAKGAIGNALGYELENISSPKSVINNTQDNLKNQGILLNYISPTNLDVNKIISAANQPWAQIPDGTSKRAPKFNKQMMTDFNSALKNNKGELMRNLNITSEKYDELSKVALAISAQESEGGGALSMIDGSTIGMTQLNPDNIFKDDKLKKAASKPYLLNKSSYTSSNILTESLIKTPAGSAVATMIYLSKLDKDSERYYNEGKKQQDRNFTKNSNVLKDAVRTNNAKYNSDGFFVEEANKRIDLSDFEGGVFSSPDAVGAQQLLNKTAGIKDRYKVSIKDGDLVVTMKTKGNANLTLPERIGYAWQSPRTLKLGDAQGDSIYSRRVKNYYDLLSNTTPTYRKEGGQTSWLNKYK